MLSPVVSSRTRIPIAPTMAARPTISSASPRASSCLAGSRDGSVIQEVASAGFAFTVLLVGGATGNAEADPRRRRSRSATIVLVF